MDLHHPLIRSVLLPAVLAWLLCGGLRALCGGRWAAVGTALGLLATCTWVTGWPPRPGSLVGTLPWVLMGAGLLGVLLEAVRARPGLQWQAMALAWALALWALGLSRPWVGLAAWAVGVLVLGAVTRARTDTADAPAVLAVAGLGLAGVALLSASLLLFELALGGALALAGTALWWLWPRARIAFGPAGRVAAALGLLSVAYATVRLTQAPVAAILVLALGIVGATAMDLWPRTAHPVWARPLWRALPVAVCAALALAIAWNGAGSERGPEGPAAVPSGEAAPYPYYTPRWE